LLRYRERVIDLNAQISDGALDLCVAEQELDGPKITGAPIDQRRLRPPEGMGAEKLRIKSIPVIHSETSRAYWRVVMQRPLSRRLVNSNSPGFLPDARR
jgi:hypothetical protein